MANITDIIAAARGFLGDSAGTRYSEPVMEVALTNALVAVNADLSMDFSYNASTRVLSPSPTKSEKYIIALAMATVLVVGEEIQSALDGGGMAWKSGLSSINLSGFHKSVSESAMKMMKRYEKTVQRNQLNDSTHGDIDLYRTGEDVVEVN